MLLADNLAKAQEISALVAVMERLDEKSRGIDELYDLMEISGYNYTDELDEIVSTELHIDDKDGTPSLVITFSYTEDGTKDTGKFYVKKKNGMIQGDF